jgi:hypothetical protein
MDFVEHAFTWHVHQKVTKSFCCGFRGKVARSTRTVQNLRRTPNTTPALLLPGEHYIFAHTSQYQQ